MPYDPNWEIALTPGKKEEINSILSRPFTYLGKGFQSYAFLSSDGDYVLKLYRFDPCKMKQGQIMVERIKKRLGIKCRLKKELYGSAKQMFEAAKITFDKLQEETELVYVHLNPGSKEWPRIVVYDYLGQSHSVAPAQTRFMLQRKAQKMFPALQGALRKDRETFKRMVHSVSMLFSSFEKKGISMTDLKMPSNFGFIGDRAIQIDFSSNYVDSEHAPDQMKQLRAKLRSWLQRNAPDAVQCLDD
jgi:hypothetical protein